MTLVNHETGEVIEAMSADEAEVVTDAIAWRLNRLADAHEEVMPMIREALTRRAWDALGYRSPGEYAAERFGGALTRLSIPVRQAVVQELTEAGMSTRAIAPVVGVSHEAVRKDQKRVNQLTPESADDARPGGQLARCKVPGHGWHGGPEGCPGESTGERPAVVGIDGKTYSRSTPNRTIEDAVAEFPDLAYYAEIGPSSDVLNMAEDLRRFRQRGELDQRLDTLRRSIAVDRAKRDGTYRPGTTAVMGDDGEYHMAPMPAPLSTTRTCPTCSGRGVIKE